MNLVTVRTVPILPLLTHYVRRKDVCETITPTTSGHILILACHARLACGEREPAN